MSVFKCVIYLISTSYFKKVFDANTFGSSEAREQIVSMAPQIAAGSGVDDKIKQEYISAILEEKNGDLFGGEINLDIGYKANNKFQKIGR